MDDQDDPDLITAAEVARLRTQAGHQVQPTTIRAYAKRPKGPSQVAPGLYDRAEVMQWIAAARPTADEATLALHQAALADAVMLATSRPGPEGAASLREAVQAARAAHLTWRQIADAGIPRSRWWLKPRTTPMAEEELPPLRSRLERAIEQDAANQDTAAVRRVLHSALAGGLTWAQFCSFGFADLRARDEMTYAAVHTTWRSIDGAGDAAQGGTPP